MVSYWLEFVLFSLRHPGKSLHGPPVSRVPIDAVNPTDRCHIGIDQQHRAGIEVVKELIARRQPILPILVRDFGNDVNADYCGRAFNQSRGLPTHYVYQRLDGFKRLMAYKELGHTHVDCYVDDSAFPGGQHSLPWRLRSPRLTTLRYSFNKHLGDRLFSFTP